MAANTLPSPGSLFCRIVLGTVAAKPGISGPEIRARLPHAEKKAVRLALRALIGAGQISVHPQRSEFHPRP